MVSFRLMGVLVVAAALWVPLAARADEGEGCETYADCAEAIEALVQEHLSVDAIVDAMTDAAETADPAEEGGGDDEGETAEAPAAPTIRPGTAADVVKHVASTDAVKRVLEQVPKAAISKFESDWARLTKGEAVALLTFSAPIVAGLVAVPGLQRPIQDVINGAINDTLKKKTPWFQIRVDLVSPNKVFELKVDVLQLLRAFGPKR